MKRVKRAADLLAASLYITDQDRKALIEAARIEPLPLPPVGDGGMTPSRPPSGSSR